MVRSAASPKSLEQEQRSLEQRAANERARAAGLPLPFPNPWDALDPTKVPRDATDREIELSYAAFRKLCRPRPRKQHRL